MTSGPLSPGDPPGPFRNPSIGVNEIPLKWKISRISGDLFLRGGHLMTSPGVAQTTKEGYVLFVYQGTLSRLNK
jgi:hypothetical protein